MELIDTHAHIYSGKFDNDFEDIINNSRAEGISAIYMPNIDAESVNAMLRAEAAYPDYCISMIGLHPGSVSSDFHDQLKEMKHWLDKRSFTAIGEIGIDLYWDKSTLAFQEEALEIQILWAKEKNLPIVLHTRDAFEETYQLVKRLHEDDITGIFHCFTGTVEEAIRVKELGMYIGIGGVATFKNGGLDKVLPHLPLEMMVLETDSPYLAPVPYRGKRNEPAYLTLIAKRLAEIMDVSLEEVAKVTTENAKNIFGKNSLP